MQKVEATYHRPNKPALILLEPLNRILRIPGALDNLTNPVTSLVLRPSPSTTNSHRADIIQNIPQLVHRRRRGGDLQLEIAALLARVRGVVGGLVFGCGFGGGS